jgi:DNA transposition AAA+ family ATPase
MSTELETHTIKRDGDLDLQVSGVLLADVSGQTPTSTKWTELALFRSAAGRYILAREKVKTRAPLDPAKGTTMRATHEAVVLPDVAALLEELRASSGGRLGRLDKELLTAAAAKDPDIAAAIRETVE